MMALEVLNKQQDIPNLSGAMPQFTNLGTSTAQHPQTHSNDIGTEMYATIPAENATINPAELNLPSNLTNVAAHISSSPPLELSSPTSLCMPPNCFAEVDEAYFNGQGVEEVDTEMVADIPRDTICEMTFFSTRWTGFLHNEDGFHHCDRGVTDEEAVARARRNLLARHEAKLHAPTVAKSNSPSQQSSTRFSLSAVKVFDDWLAAHRENPYPTSDERDQLAKESGLTPKQVNTWFANARRRQLDPMARYVSSSSEDEAASIEDIRFAAESMPVPQNIYGPSSYSPPSEYSFSSPGNPFDSPWSPPQPADFGGLSSASSIGSAFDQCPEARWFGPPRKGRKRYASSIYSSCSSAASLASADLNQRTLPRPSALIGTNIPPAPQSMIGQFSSKVSSSSQKKHKCKICDKRFTRASSLQTHMYSHTGEKPFACEVEGCGRHFSVVSNLRRHRKVHRMNESAQRSDSVSLDGAEALVNRAESPELVSTGSTLKPLRIPSHVRGAAENRSNDSTTTDDFGNSLFKNLLVPEKANREVIQKLRAEAMRAQSKANSELPKTLNPTFQCTFCHVKLSEKAWRRHEESQHVPQRQWICMPCGDPFILSEFRAGGIHLACRLCNRWGVTADHVKVCPNRASDCLARPVEERTFYRKDHLVQHLRRFHDTSLSELEICFWESKNAKLNRVWGCGFCGEGLPNWNERAAHIAAHFRQGLDMSAWDSSRIGFVGAGENELPLITGSGVDMQLGDGNVQERFENGDAEQGGFSDALSRDGFHDLSWMDLK